MTTPIVPPEGEKKQKLRKTKKVLKWLGIIFLGGLAVKYPKVASVVVSVVDQLPQAAPQGEEAKK